MPNALSQQGGYSLGAQAGEEPVRHLAADAGFTRLRRVAETPFTIVRGPALEGHLRRRHTGSRGGRHHARSGLEGSAGRGVRPGDRLPGRLPDRPVGPEATAEELHKEFGGLLPEQPHDPRLVVREPPPWPSEGERRAAAGRFFGFVFGGASTAALAADWLTVRGTRTPACTPRRWPPPSWRRWSGRLAELFGLPPTVTAGFVTGAQMANFTALAAARHEVLRRFGWDVERAGLAGAPRIRVLVGAERHDTIDRAVRFLGLGTDNLVPVPVDDQGRMRSDALGAVLAEDAGPAIVCAQVGNVNTGAIDPVGDHGTSRMRPVPGFTWTARSGCGPW